MPKMPVSIDLAVAVIVAVVIYLLDKSGKSNAFLTTGLLILTAALFIDAVLQLPSLWAGPSRAVVVWRASSVIVLVVFCVARFGIWIWPEEATPNFKILMYDYVITPWRDDPSYGAVCLIAGIANSGDVPSIAREFKLSLPRKDQGAFTGVISDVGSRPWRIEIPDAGFDVNLKPEDSLPDKGLRNPIAPGSEITGYVLARFPGEPSGKLGALQRGGIELEIEDIKGRKYKRYIAASENLGRTPSYAGTTLNQPLPDPPIAAIQLTPMVDEETATNTDATGAEILFANVGGKDKKDISKLFNLPPIKSVSVPESNRNKLRVAAGNKRGSTFLRFEIPELKINEMLYAEVTFLEPQKITSPDAWGKQYGYDGTSVLVRRLFLGKEVKVTPSDADSGQQQGRSDKAEARDDRPNEKEPTP